MKIESKGPRLYLLAPEMKSIPWGREKGNRIRYGGQGDRKETQRTRRMNENMHGVEDKGTL